MAAQPGFGGRRFVQNLATLAIGEGLTRLFTLIAYVHLARSLAPEAYGHLELTLAILMFATVVVDQGLPAIGTRELAKNPAEARKWIESIVPAQLFMAMIVSLAITLVARFLPGPLPFLLAVYSLTLVSLPFVLGWAFQGLGRMLFVTGPQALRQGLFLAGALLFVSHPEDVRRVAVVELASASMTALVSFALYQSLGHGFSLRRTIDRTLLREARPVAVSLFVWSARMYLPVVALGSLVNASDLGQFGVSHRTLMVVLTLMGVYFTNLLPTLSAESSDPKNLTRSLVWSASLIAALALLLAVGVARFSAELCALLYGEVYARGTARSILATLIWAVPILALRRHANTAAIVLGTQRADMAASLFGAFVTIVSFVPFVSTFGPIGAAYAMVLGEAIGAGAAIVFASRALGSRLRHSSLRSS
ncbi:MAG: oligosaccharide flippase family protein [Deltaproteobacteria bacterium]|nr:oligosaccharide flippase family protein [Deltaproteobacteria bacterium]